MQWHSNPFSSRFVRPGAIDYRFPAKTNAAGLVVTLRRLGWHAQIIGPHGTGKSTLLHTLRPHLQQQGRDVIWYTLHAGQRRLAAPAAIYRAEPAATGQHACQQGSLAANTSLLAATTATGPIRWCRSTQIIVDGYEQLGMVSRLWLRTKCRWFGAGLLLTSHQDAGLPTLHQTSGSFAVFQDLVDTLARGDLAWTDRAELHACLIRARGNVRDALFELYDRFEQATSAR